MIELDIPACSQKRARGLSKLRLGLAIGLRLLLCPGDDIALAITQAVGSTSPDMPTAAIIHKEPKVVTVFEAQILKK